MRCDTMTLGTGTCHTTKQHDNRTGNKDVVEIMKTKCE